VQWGVLERALLPAPFAPRAGVVYAADNVRALSVSDGDVALGVGRARAHTEPGGGCTSGRGRSVWCRLAPPSTLHLAQATLTARLGIHLIGPKDNWRERGAPVAFWPRVTKARGAARAAGLRKGDMVLSANGLPAAGAGSTTEVH
jgi:hypothetical protein